MITKYFKKNIIPIILSVSMLGFNFGAVKATELKDLIKGEYYTIVNSKGKILRVERGGVSFQGSGDIALFNDELGAGRIISREKLDAFVMSYGKEDYEVEIDTYEKGIYLFKHLIGLFGNLDKIKVELEKQQKFERAKTDKIYSVGYAKIASMPDYEERKKQIDTYKNKMDKEWTGMVASQNAQLNFFYLLKSKFQESDKLIVTDKTVFLYSKGGEIKFKTSGFDKFNAKKFFRRFVGNQMDIAEVVMWIYFQSEKNYKD